MRLSLRPDARTLFTITAGAGLTALLAGCTSTATTAGDAGSIAVTSTDDACDVAVAEAPSGVLQFSVTNSGSQVTEFYLLAEDGLQVLGEVENIGPGLSRDLVLQAAPGTYTVACKPGMTGDGIRSMFTVTDSGVDTTPTGEDAELITRATTAYAAYVKDQTEQLLTGTEEFAQAYATEDDDLARSLYAATRMHWERIEPVAESFGNLDPILDAREADLEDGQEWTGWHRIEKDLWPPADGYTLMTPAERKAMAAKLVEDTKTLYDRTRDMTFTVDQLGNGAKELLDEVATGKITGEEEIWSHTDLWDFQANLEGAKVMYAGLKPLLARKDAALATTLDAQFALVQALLDQYRSGDGFVLYTDLTADQVKALAAAVDGLGEPLSRVTSAVLVGAQGQ
jgi:iron uptake system component EfeO